MRLILAEKPDAASSFALALGASRKQGYYVTPSGDIITFCIGHLLELYAPEDYSEDLASWSMDHLPIMPDPFRYKPATNGLAQLNVISSLIASLSPNDTIIVATDADREGELIARLVLTWAKPKTARIYRFWSSSSLTSDVILSGLEKIRPVADYDTLYHAALFRQRADWLVGINFSRFFTLAFASTSTFGRVQTPILHELVARDAAIQGHIKTSYFTYHADLNIAEQQARAVFRNPKAMAFTDDRQLVFPSEDDFPLYEASRLPSTFVIRSITPATQTVKPPRLFSLSSLQEAANIVYGFTASETLEIAQALYERHKCLSYPRTPARALSEENFPLVSALYSKFSTLYLELFAASSPPRLENKNIFNGEEIKAHLEGHHALIPLAQLPIFASADEKAIFDLVLFSFARVCAPDFIYQDTAIELRAEGTDAELLLRSRNILSPGFKSVPSPKASPEQESPTKDAPPALDLSRLAAGQSAEILATLSQEHFNKAPKRYTDASLIAYMDAKGLGTEATRAAIISGLFKHSLCERIGRYLAPTDRGKHLIAQINAIDNSYIKTYLSPEETAKWEAALSSSPKEFIRSITENVSQTFDTLRAIEVKRYRIPPAGICPRCGQGLYRSQKAVFCEGLRDKKCNFSFPLVFCGHHFNDTEIKTILSGKKTRLLSLVSEKGQFKAKIFLLPDGPKILGLDFAPNSATMQAPSGARRNQ